MSVTMIGSWREPGCGSFCHPRSHDPRAHEAYGRLLESLESRPRIVTAGALMIDLDTRSVAVHDVNVKLSSREWGLLAFLAEHPGRWHTAVEIVRGAWPRGERPVAVARVVKTTRARLRQKLGIGATQIESRHSIKDGWMRLRAEETRP